MEELLWVTTLLVRPAWYSWPLLWLLESMDLPRLMRPANWTLPLPCWLVLGTPDSAHIQLESPAYDVAYNVFSLPLCWWPVLETLDV